MIDFDLLKTGLSHVPEFESSAGEVAVADAEHQTGDGEQSPFQDEEPDSNYGPQESSPVFKLPEIIDSATFVSTPIPEPQHLIEGLVHQGTKVIVGGGSKSFKTWVQLDAGLSVAYGMPWLEFPTVRGRVLFVNFEIQPAFFQKRIAKIAETRGISLEPGWFDVWNLRGYSAPYALLIPKIIERIKSVGYVLIVLDPIYKLYGAANENDASEVAQLLNSLEKVCVETGAAVMFGAHYSKGNQAAKESIDRISGSGVFARDPDSIIPFTRHEEEGSFVIEPTLRNLPPVEPFVVSWNFPLMERDTTLDPSKLKQSGGRPKEHTQDDLLSVLGSDGLSSVDWRDSSEKNGISRATYFRLKKELMDSGRVIWSSLKSRFVPVSPRNTFDPS